MRAVVEKPFVEPVATAKSRKPGWLTPDKMILAGLIVAVATLIAQVVK